jgi:hypothetical protein
MGYETSRLVAMLQKVERTCTYVVCCKWLSMDGNVSYWKALNCSKQMQREKILIIVHLKCDEMRKIQ